MPEDEYLTIGQVVEMLRGEFPDLTVSSLRFLEQEGLLTPERTEGGHRRYVKADVERVRFIKEMQRRFYPLHVIRDLLHDAKQKKENGERLFLRPLPTTRISSASPAPSWRSLRDWTKPAWGRWSRRG